MRDVVSKGYWLALVVLIAGCDIGNRGPQAAFRNFTTAANALADLLQSVKDADSARAACGDLDRRFSALNDAVQRMGDTMRADPTLLTRRDMPSDLATAMQTAGERISSETKRIEFLTDLPVEFWKSFETNGVEFVVKSCEMAQAFGRSADPATFQYLKDVQNLMQNVGFERVVKVNFTTTSPEVVQTACDKLQKLAPDAKLYRTESGGDVTVVMGPVVDFGGFVSGVDFGSVIFKNEPRRLFKLAVSRGQLGLAAGGLPEESQADREARELREREAEAMMAKQREEQDRAAAAMRAAREREENGPDSSDPQYFEAMLKRMESDEHFKKQRAIDALLTKSPSDVESAETRKKIAQAFKRLAEEEHGFDQEKAIKGLVIWGGKYSGPILLKMLRRTRSFHQERIIQALGEVKYGPAATDIAAKLGDFHLHECAVGALQELGPAAEDALIAVGPSQNPNVCLAAVRLLGEYGTAKCLPLLSKGLTSRNMEVREACKTGIRQVKEREKAAKDREDAPES